MGQRPGGAGPPSPFQRLVKRAMDLVLAGVGLVLFGWVIVAAVVVATLDTREIGLFRQKRAGRHGRPFDVLKIRTMRSDPTLTTTVTASTDVRITRIGRFFRRTKIDELPQLINVLFGQMSLVGPRPDVPEYAERLRGADRLILDVRPGLTGPATIVFRREEELLSRQPDPERYNKEVIYPRKVRLNRAYVLDYSLRRDLAYICRTLFG